MNYLVYNRDIIDDSKNFLSGNNRAFLYGDGIFETLILNKNRLMYLEDHFTRLKDGLATFGITQPEFLNPAFLQSQTLRLAEMNHLSSPARIKILLWRKSGGLYTPLTHDAELIVTAEPFIPGRNVKSKVLFYHDIRKSASSISRFKTINAAPYVLASIAKSKLQADDMVLFDSEGHVSECTSSNLFFIKGDILYTPSIDCACIEGILRKQIIDFCEKKKIKIETGRYTPEHLLQADFAFTSNIAGLISISQIEGTKYKTTSEIFDVLKAAFNLL